MDKNNFIFHASPYGSGTYKAETNGFQIEISEVYFSDERVSFAEKVAAAYQSRLFDLATFCKESECFQTCYPDETVESIMIKLHIPIIKVDAVGGICTYCNHELDDDHIIDLEFEGVLERFFSVNIDG